MADCCNELKARLAALEAEVKKIKPVDEENIISKALGRLPSAPVITNLQMGVKNLGFDLGIVKELATGASQWVNTVGKPVLPVVESDIDRLLAQIKDTASKSDVDRLIQQANQASKDATEALKEAGNATGKANDAIGKAREAVENVIKKAQEWNEKYAKLASTLSLFLNMLSAVGGMAGLLSLFATLRLIFPKLDQIDSHLVALDNALYRVYNNIEGAYIIARSAKSRAELAINTAFDAASQVMSAKIKAQEAIDAANSAKGKSEVAINAANSAIRKADNSQLTADEAKTLANEARDTASNVRGIAEDAKGLAQSTANKIGNINADISGLRGVTTSLKQEDVRLNNKIDNIKTIDIEARKLAERAESRANNAYDLGVTNGSKISGIQGLLDIAKSDISSLKSEDTKLRNKDDALEALIRSIKPNTGTIDEVARASANSALGIARNTAGEIPGLKAKDAELERLIRGLKDGKDGASATEVAAKLKADPGFIALTKGDKGKDGYTPKKGKDYNDGVDGYTPRKGIDYNDGLPGINGLNGLPGKPGKPGRNGIDGIDGYTPKKGKDYNDGKDGKDVNPQDLAELKAGQKRTQDLVTNLIGSLPGMLAVGFLGVRPALQPDFNQVNQNITNITNNMPVTACSAFPAAQQTQRVINNNTNTRIGQTNQRIGIVNGIVSGMNTFLTSNVMSAVNVVVTTTVNIKNKLESLATWLHLDRALGIINLWLTLHNAYMVSSNLGQTLLSTVNNILSATGLGLKDAEGNPLDLNALIGSEIDYFFKGLLGVETWDGMKDSYKKWSVVYQASANLLFSIQSIGYSILAALEVVGSWVAQIGNALKYFRVIGEKAFGWFNPQPSFQNKFFTAIEEASTLIQNIDSVSQNVLGVTQTVAQIQTQKTELDNAIKQAQGSSQGTKPPEAATEKAKQEQVKAVSISPPISDANLLNPDD